ncbi:MAG: aspartyl/asparaginyl beta-hydroxylase domain-containing protein [Pirellulales bacterium]|nr:aspartyl/asparaginyl beta-hydroxylase domain-containing protein [Pirellulales bacterium]
MERLHARRAGDQAQENRALCPDTCAVLARVPSLMQAFFSILDPGKSIPLHNGPYLGYLRYHLGLRVPKHAPPTLWIADEPYTWREGEAVMFDDSWPHRVENHARELRGVLIIDILRPLPLVPSLVNRLTTQVIVRHTYGRHVADRVRRFKEAA